MKQLKSTFVKQDEMILELLNQDTNLKIEDLEKNKYFGLIVNWWNNNIETEENSKMKSTIIWAKFKKDNTNMNDITIEYFKEVICSLLPASDITKQTRARNCAIEINNIKWKSETLTKIDIDINI
jgi:predicted RNA-binding protein Jag